jgi:competence protein ComEC
VLIDGGTRQGEGRGEVGRAVIVPYLQSIGVNRIDALVVTHADSDHCNALPFVLHELPVGLVIDGAASVATPSDSAKGSSASSGQGALDADYQSARAAWRERGIPAYAAHPGQRLELGDGISLTVIAPLEPVLPGDNNNSAVLRLDYGAVGMLFTGDIESAAEERLVRRGMPVRCTVLKLAHHGSKTSTTPLLLNAAQPKIAVLSCGRYNSFGHPAPQTLHRLNERRVPVYRTDVHGAIEIFSDGRACWVQTMR